MRFSYLISIVLIALLAACSGGVRTFSTQAKGTDLARYKTYAWVMPGDHESAFRTDDKIYSGLILKLANAELKEKGFVLDTLKPECVFTFDTRVSEQVEYSAGAPPAGGYAYTGYGYYGGYTPFPVYSGRTSRHEYEEGMLYIDMFDTQTNVPLWGGWAKAKRTAKSDVEADVRKAVKDIFVRLRVRHQ